MSERKRHQESKQFGIKLAEAIRQRATETAPEHDLDARFVLQGAAEYLYGLYVVSVADTKEDRSRAFGAKLGEAVVTRMDQASDEHDVDLAAARAAAADRLERESDFRLDPPIDPSDLKSREN